MLIVVGSTSPVKVTATEQAFAEYFNDFTVKGLRLPSNVNPYPMSDDETLQGALNRAETTFKLEPSADFAVGIEGGLQRLREWTIVKHIAVVLHANEVGVGTSAGYVCPPEMLRQIEPTSDSSRKNIDAFFGKQEILSKEGPEGVLTNLKLTRTSVSKNAVIFALTRFVNPRFYDK
jgi:inosine/xanthosine triphosphatase